MNKITNRWIDFVGDWTVDDLKDSTPELKLSFFNAPPAGQTLYCIIMTLENTVLFSFFLLFLPLTLCHPRWKNKLTSFLSLSLSLRLSFTSEPLCVFCHFHMFPSPFVNLLENIYRLETQPSCRFSVRTNWKRYWKMLDMISYIYLFLCLMPWTSTPAFPRCLYLAISVLLWDQTPKIKINK